MHRTGILVIIKNIVKDIIHENLCLENYDSSFIFGTVEHNVREYSNLEEDLGLDSLNMCDLAMRMEDEFGIEIADDRVGLWKLVGDVVIFVLNETAKQFKI